LPSFAQTEAVIDKRPLAVTDIMQFREIERQVWSDDGRIYAYDAVPDRGDPTGYVVRLNAEGQSEQVFEISRATHPRVTESGDFVVFTQHPSLLATERATSAEAKKALVKHQVLVNTRTGEQRVFENAERAEFTGDGKTLVLLQQEQIEVDGESEERSLLRMVNLEANTERTLANIATFSVADNGPRLALLTESDNEPGKVWVRNTQNHSQLELLGNVGNASVAFAFNETGTSLAFLAADEGADKEAPARNLWLWSFGETTPKQIPFMREGYQLSQHSDVKWSREDTAIVVGARTPEITEESLPAPETDADLYSVERILSDRRLQVWHGEDERIITHQRESHSQRTRATAEHMYWLGAQEWVALSDDPELTIWIDEDYQAGLQFDARPYLREITWNGFHHDLYHLNLATGEKQLIAEKLPSWQRGSMSPNGQYVAYLQDEKLFLFNRESGQSIELAKDSAVSWVDEENDLPAAAYGYGFGGWLEDSSAFFIYDRFDIWQVDTRGIAENVTASVGRDTQQQLRIEAPSEGFYDVADTLLVRSFSEVDKSSGFHTLNVSMQTLETLVAGPKTYRLVKRFHDADRLFFTAEDFRQFPNVQVADLSFQNANVITDVNPQQENFIWGNAELVEWESTRGEPLQGVLIKPDNYDASRRYPVMVYYYEKFSQRLHQFNQMKVNHRPNFPFYLGQDYLVFLPDIHFRLGAPGPSATESLVPAMEMLVEQGIADPDGLGLHGHSWSGYQTAFVVTETDIFDAAVAGAPVSNMTSAYSGIRWGSGLARQFQYEQGQSRLGVNMYEELTPYLENSPVFYADRINTPMLIQFGDEDEAVPWEQGIEYYLALRRLNKPVVMLHYEGEPHHLRRYANKVDYTLKMLEFFDYHLKGKGNPEWWLEGLEYQSYN